MGEEVPEQTGPTIIPPEDQENIKLGHESEPFNLRHHQSKAESKPEPNVEKPKRKISLPAILVSLFIIIVTLGAISALFYSKNQAKVAAINNFEDCVAAGNPIMESYPEQCAANGQTFTRTLTEEEQKKLSPDPTAYWQTYEDSSYKFSVKYPQEWTIKKTPEFDYRGDNYIYSVQFSASDYDSKLINDNTINLFVFNSSDYKYPPEKIEGEILSVEPITFASRTGYKTTNYGNDGNYTCYIIDNENIYEICFTENTAFNNLPKSNFNPEVIQQILSTFQFTDASSTVDTSNWNTYNSKSFTVLYPSDWTEFRYKNSPYDSEPFDDDIIFRSPDYKENLIPAITNGAYIQVTKRPNTKNESLEKYIENGLPTPMKEKSMKTLNKVTYGANTYQNIFSCWEGCGDLYYLESNNTIYAITFECKPGCGSKSESDKNKYAKARDSFLEKAVFSN